MDIRLIAFDLDGTLLRSDKSISPRTMRQSMTIPAIPAIRPVMLCASSFTFCPLIPDIFAVSALLPTA